MIWIKVRVSSLVASAQRCINKVSTLRPPRSGSNCVQTARGARNCVPRLKRREEMTCHSANSVDFSRTPFFASTSLRRSQMQRRFTDAPADQSTTASAATRLAAHHAHLSDRARTALLPSAAPDAEFIAHGKRRGGCLQLRCRQTLPALPLWQIKARRFVLSEDRSHFRLRLRHRCCDRVSLIQQSIHLP